MAINHSLSPFLISIDSQELVNVIHNGSLTYENIISECRCLINRLDRVQLQHVFREQNQVADILAKEAIGTSNVGTTTTIF